MGWEAWFTLAVVALVFIALVRNVGSPDVIVLGGSVLVGLAGIVTPAEVVSGFANPSVLTIGALFVVAAGMRETGALDRIGTHMLGACRTTRGALLRVMPQVATLSAFLNNTAVVAMVMPIIIDWCRKHRISPSRLLIPVAYLAILGGMCTLIGTSRNLIVHELMLQAVDHNPAHTQLAGGFSLFELAWLGVPCTLVGAVYLLFVAPRLLPDHDHLLEPLGAAVREYLVDMRVESGCPLIGKTVQDAGLRRLPGLFLVEIVRGEHIIAPVRPDEVLEADDRLSFTGVVATIVELERIPGLVPVADEPIPESARHRVQRRYCEAVISRTSPLLGRNIRDANFRARYNAAIVAVHRGGRRLIGRIGDFVLRPGDTLLLQAGPHFVEANRNNPDFVLVSSLDGARPVRHDRAGLAFVLLGLLVLLMALPQVSFVLAALAVAGLMIALRCISSGDARQAIQWNVLIVIAGAFGLGHALDSSGAADALAHLILTLVGQLGPHVALAVVYVVTVVFGILITSNATAVLMFPIALALATQLQVDPRPFAVAIAAAASASFASPVSYQTNMLVYGPGGYRYADFLRVGLPLNVLLAVVAVLLIPLIWPLTAQTS